VRFLCLLLDLDQRPIEALTVLASDVQEAHQRAAAIMNGRYGCHGFELWSGGTCVLTGRKDQSASPTSV
jgi:hypothetical protein